MDDNQDASRHSSKADGQTGGRSRSWGEGTGGDQPSKPSAGLYVIATPIGNLRDVTLRALDLLATVDLVACEDTRVTRRLLAAYGIAADTSAYHEHNAQRERPKLLRRLEQGQSIALVSDAGTPLISDPGFKLVSAAIEAGIPVTPVPGASAILPALVASGLPSDRFLFAGFVPSRGQARRRFLTAAAGTQATLIMFESGPRLASSLADMAEILGPRQAAVGRELTKKFEEMRRGPLHALAARFSEAGPPKGEITIVVAPPAEPPAPDAAELDRQLEAALARDSLKQAVAEVAKATGLPRREVYQRALTLRAKTEP